MPRGPTGPQEMVTVLTALATKLPRPGAGRRAHLPPLYHPTSVQQFPCHIRLSANHGYRCTDPASTNRREPTLTPDFHGASRPTGGQESSKPKPSRVTPLNDS